ncbi:phage tail tape measure protein [Leptospira sp. 96542]|nr:phage tail tape measure protein [Leptospira sp. 96542]
MAASNDLALRVTLQAIDKALTPLKNINRASEAVTRSLFDARENLRKLNRQQAALDGFEKQRAAMQSAANQVKVYEQNLGALHASQSASAKQIKTVEHALAKARTAYAGARDGAFRLRQELNSMGVSKVAGVQGHLRVETEKATAAIQKQIAELRLLAQRDATIAKLREQHVKSMMHAGAWTAVGVGMRSYGQSAMRSVQAPVSSYSEHEQAMLGIARQVAGARDATGQLTPVYREIEAQIRSMSEQLPYTTVQIAEMVTAAARMEVPTEELERFTRLSAMMATAFDGVPDEIAESMGKIGKNFRIPLPQIEGLADSINWLDDNAISKGSDIIDFLNRTSGVVSTVAMTARNAAALGSTLLTLGERAETASTAANAIVQKLSAAEKGSKKFRRALDEIGLAPEAVQRGMQTDAMATLFQVVEAINKLPASKRTGVMVELAGLEHADTLAKLVSKPDELRRQLDLANGAEASGSMRREFSARNATLEAQWLETKNRIFNTMARLGETLRPTLVSLMDTANGWLSTISRWISENPALFSALMKTAGVLAVLTVGIGGIVVAVAPLLGSLSLLNFLLNRQLISWGLLSQPVNLLKVALAGVGRVVLWLSRLLFANPIGLAVTAIAGAAYLIYKNWEPISKFFKDLWDGIVSGFKRGIETIMGWLDTVMAPLRWLQEKFGKLFAGAAMASAAAGVSASPGTSTPVPRIVAPAPITTSAAKRPQVVREGDNITLVMQAAPGMSEQAVGRAVVAELNRRQTQQAARTRSALGDIN